MFQDTRLITHMNVKENISFALNKSKIKEDFNLDIPYWKDSVKKCIKKINA